MRRLLALPLAAAALATAAPAAQASWGYCGPTRVVGACVGYTCVDICAIEPYAYTYCEHPLPYNWCKVVNVGG